MRPLIRARHLDESPRRPRCRRARARRRPPRSQRGRRRRRARGGAHRSSSATAAASCTRCRRRSRTIRQGRQAATPARASTRRKTRLDDAHRRAHGDARARGATRGPQLDLTHARAPRTGAARKHPGHARHRRDRRRSSASSASPSRSAPRAETEWYNFGALNFPPDHPAMDAARHALSRRGRAAAHAHVAGAGAHAAALCAADPHPRAGHRVSPRLLRRVARAGVRADRRALPSTKASRFVDLKATLTHFARALLRRDAHALPPELLPVHRAVGRDGRAVRRLRRRRLRGVQGHGLDGDPRLGHGASQRARGRGHRQRAIHRLGVRHGPGAHRDAALRHSRHSPALRLRRALPRAGGANERLVRVAATPSSDSTQSPAAAARSASPRTPRRSTSSIALRDDLAPIVVARVVEEAPHPDSDHLHVTKVDVGTGELLDVVCGAPNVTAGKLYPFAPTGTMMPGGLKIEKRKIRGADLERHAVLGARARARRGARRHHGARHRRRARHAVPRARCRRRHAARHRRRCRTGPTCSRTSASRARSPRVTGDAARAAATIGADAVAIPEREARPPRAATRAASCCTSRTRRLASRYMGVVDSRREGRAEPAVARGAPRGGRRRARSTTSSTPRTTCCTSSASRRTRSTSRKLDSSEAAAEDGRRARARRPARRSSRSTASSASSTPTMTVIADAERAAGDRRRHGRPRQRGRRERRPTSSSRSRTSIRVAYASHAPRARPLDRRELPLRARRRRRARAAGARARRAARSSRSPAERSTARRWTSTPATRRAQPLVLRTARVQRVLGVALPPSASPSCCASIGCRRRRRATTGAAVHVVAPTWRRDLVARGRSHRGGRAPARLRSLPDEIRPYRPGTVPDAPLWTRGDRCATRSSAPGCSRRGPMPFVAGGDDHVRVSNPLAENEAHLRRTRARDAGATRRVQPRAHAGQRAAVRDRLRVRAGRATRCPTRRVRVGAPRDGRSRAAALHRSQARVRSTRGMRRGSPSCVARVGVPGAGSRARAGRPESGDLLWRIVVDGERARQRSARRRSTRRCGPRRRSAWSSCSAACRTATSRRRASTRIGGADAQAPARGRAAYRPLPTTPASVFDLALLVPARRHARPTWSA